MMILSGQGLSRSAATTPSVHRAAKASRHLTWSRCTRKIWRKHFRFVPGVGMAISTSRGLAEFRRHDFRQRGARVLGELRGESRPFGRLPAADRVYFTHERQTAIERDVAGRNV